MAPSMAPTPAPPPYPSPSSPPTSPPPSSPLVARPPRPRFPPLLILPVSIIVIILPRIPPHSSSSPATHVQGASRLESAPSTLARGVRLVPGAPRAPDTPTARSTPDAAPVALAATSAPGSPLAAGMAGAPNAQVRNSLTGPTSHDVNAPQIACQAMARTLSRPRKPPRTINQDPTKSLQANASTRYF